MAPSSGGTASTEVCVWVGVCVCGVCVHVWYTVFVCVGMYGMCVMFAFVCVVCVWCICYDMWDVVV